MKTKVQRVIQRRKAQIVISVGLLFTAFGLLMFSQGPNSTSLSGKLGEKLAFAALIALILQWLNVWFTELGPKEDLYSSSANDYHQALRDARKRIWILQTWLPGIEKDADEIASDRDSDFDLRLLLASFKCLKKSKKGPGNISPIFARILGRKIIDSDAKSLIKNSTKRFIDLGKKSCIRFTYGHHPGWIAVVDSFVFWGPTPVQVDNQSRDIFFYRDSCRGERGEFWEAQFCLLWKKYSHGYDEERRKYNRRLYV